MFLILEEVKMKNTIPFAYSNCLCIAPKVDAEERGKGSRVALGRDMAVLRDEDHENVEVVVISDDN